jgi:hypothetical protein
MAAFLLPAIVVAQAPPPASPPAAIAANCDRACLVGVANTYLVALVKHDASSLPLAADFRNVENATVKSPGEGLWKLAQGIRAQRQYVADVPAGEVGVMAIFDGVDDQLGVLALHLKIAGGKIAEAESVVSQDGEGGPGWMPEGFLFRESPYVREVPAKFRTSRAGLTAAVNKYWDLATTTHKGYEAPYASDCFRYENGMTASWEAELSDEQLAQQKADLVGNGFVPGAVDGRIWGCARELVLTTQPWTAARDRHLVIDQERGLVMSFTLVDAGGPGLLGAATPAIPGQRQGGAPGSAPGGGPGRPPGAGPPGGAPAALSAGSLTRPSQIGTTISSARNMAAGPPGMSMKGMQASRGERTIYQAQVNWIADGKIKREQVFMHVLPAKTQYPK